ncbi:MAG: SMC-Scp complex subunit ScpB [SAR92 clade bacterium]|jgi:segregation and condensation protein B|uniref:SMC-Scp complex subunit ScpB n=1 Tax=SAR92 clade bacterium TaxID=2315479 RepID=A0A520LNN3_9GAMM|nr:MAG: SMC-Scp complex subunit ScpB [SAR92 clade bacterium]|tara:strand:- start:1148 stop:1783 length:636 start_codon:yes stop_codon:yes gene_type:complete
MNSDFLRQILEAAIMVSDKPMDVSHLEKLFDEKERPHRDEIRAALDEITTDCRDKGFELVKVSSGYRFQTKQSLSAWVSRVWEEKPKKFSRAMLETLALIAYRQPTTRGDIESVRGVSVSSDIIRVLDERGWIRVVGHRDVPGKPELLATTKEFLDYFNLKSLDQLPSLAEIKDFTDVDPALELLMPIDSLSSADQDSQIDVQSGSIEPEN